jgi:hypothetical protein
VVVVIAGERLPAQLAARVLGEAEASRSYLATATEYGVCHLPAIGELAESRARMPAQP